MTIVAAGSLSESLDAARTTLLACAAFSAAVEAADPDRTVTQHIFFDCLADSEGLAGWRPYALLKYCDRGSTVIAEGIQVDLIVAGGIVLWLEMDAREDLTDHNDQYLDACNWFGQVIDQMEALSGSGQYLPFRSEMLVAPQRTMRSQRREDHDFWSAGFLLVYGDQL